MYDGMAYSYGNYFHTEGRRKTGKKRRKQRLWAAIVSGTAAVVIMSAAAGIPAVMTGGVQRHIALGGRGTVQSQTAVTVLKVENELWSKREALAKCVTVRAETLRDRMNGTGILQSPVVIIDAGHGGEDEGGSRGGLLEKDINLNIAVRLQTKLNEMGYQTIMVRTDDTYLSKDERVRTANKNPGSIYISIHQNTYEEAGASGIETWYDGSDASRDSRRLAQLIHRETLSSTGAQERELRDDADFCVTGKTTMPACLIETGFLSNAAERSLLATEEYQERIADGIASGIELYVHPKTMYLTFDDGPSAENTSMVLDILKERNIKATFFVVGENVRKNPEVAKRIVEEGHTIGIHCNSHDYQTLYQSRESYLKDFDEAYKAVEEVTGVKPVLYRFPGGSINSYDRGVSERIIEAMTERGFVYYDWNASLEDAVKKSAPETLIENARSTTLGRKKVVMLAHDIVRNTALCLDDMLDQLPEYRMEPLTAEVEPIQFQ